MLEPKKPKYRKQFKQAWHLDGVETRGVEMEYGEFGLRVTEPGWLTNREIEAARVAVNREMKRGGKVWLRKFPDKPITKKPAETRMGSGKGATEYWVAVCRPGHILFEIAGVSEAMARKAFKLAGAKLSLGTKFIKRLETLV